MKLPTVSPGMAADQAQSKLQAALAELVRLYDIIGSITLEEQITADGGGIISQLTKHYDSRQRFLDDLAEDDIPF